MAGRLIMRPAALPTQRPTDWIQPSFRWGRLMRATATPYWQIRKRPGRAPAGTTGMVPFNSQTGTARRWRQTVLPHWTVAAVIEQRQHDRLYYQGRAVHLDGGHRRDRQHGQLTAGWPLLVHEQHAYLAQRRGHVGQSIAANADLQSCRIDHHAQCNQAASRHQQRRYLLVLRFTRLDMERLSTGYRRCRAVVLWTRSRDDDRQRRSAAATTAIRSTAFAVIRPVTSRRRYSI